MGKHRLTNESAPSTPAAGITRLWTDTTTKKLHSLADDGINRLIGGLGNANTADVTANAADTYLTGSSISIPPSLLRVGGVFIWKFAMSKTAAGTATPIWNIRFGVNGTTADTARVTHTGIAQTAAVDNGMAEIMAIVRTAGAAGVLSSYYALQHLGAAAGLANAVSDVKQNNSAAFDMTVANSIIGVSMNPGAAGVWTFQLVAVNGFNL